MTPEEREIIVHQAVERLTKDRSNTRATLAAALAESVIELAETRTARDEAQRNRRHVLERLNRFEATHRETHKKNQELKRLFYGHAMLSATEQHIDAETPRVEFCPTRFQHQSERAEYYAGEEEEGDRRKSPETFVNETEYYASRSRPK